MELTELWEMYRDCRLLHSHPNTYRKYCYAIQKLGRHIGRRPTTSELDDDTLIRFRAAMLNDGLSRATANSYVGHLVALWNFAFRRGFVGTGPTVKEIAEVHREPVSLTLDEFSTLLHAAGRLNYSITDIPARDWWRSLFLTLYDTGWRVSAARSVLWCDVSLNDATLLVRGEFQKTLRDSRKDVSAETIDAIRAIAEPRRREVWPWDRNPAYFWQLAKKIFLAAGLPDDRRYWCHAIRRTHGTLVAARLGDFAAADSLQHASVATFRRHYRDSSQIDSRQVLDALPRPKAV